MECAARQLGRQGRERASGLPALWDATTIQTSGAGVTLRNNQSNEQGTAA
jgi:hypothetical protein